MNHEGEYFLIARRDLERMEKQGWTLVGFVRRIGYVGMHTDNVLVRRPTSKLPKPNPPLEAPR